MPTPCFYIDLLPLVILSKMRHHIRRHSALRKGDMQTFGRQEVDSKGLKFPLLHQHVLHVPKLVLTHCVGVQPKRPYATDVAVSQELRRYQDTID